MQLVVEKRGKDQYRRSTGEIVGRSSKDDDVANVEQRFRLRDGSVQVAVVAGWYLAASELRYLRPYAHCNYADTFGK